MCVQIGEALQIHSGGLLAATPHYVRSAAGPAAVGVSRNTYALFMQPDVLEPMEPPAGVCVGGSVVVCWSHPQVWGGSRWRGHVVC